MFLLFFLTERNKETFLIVSENCLLAQQEGLWDLLAYVRLFDIMEKHIYNVFAGPSLYEKGHSNVTMYAIHI